MGNLPGPDSAAAAVAAAATASATAAAAAAAAPGPTGGGPPADPDGAGGGLPDIAAREVTARGTAVRVTQCALRQAKAQSMLWDPIKLCLIKLWDSD